ncbi:MAG TPA: hypothetical protein VFT63_07195 [bacterium]|nr:hypothetical protein [bacterium]
MVLGPEVRNQQSYCREVYGPIAEQIEDDGIFSSSPGCLDTAIGGILGEMEHLHAISEHRRTAFSEIQLSLVQDGEVGDEGRFRLPLALGKEFRSRDDFLIGELINKRENSCAHDPFITWRSCLS